MTKPAVLMIGNYLASPRHNRNVWHELADRLQAAGWDITCSSSREAQLARLLDMLGTILKHRNQYALAQIDVFSGRAFIYAELAAALLGWLHKALVLTLHGGGLPEFASRHPGRMRRMLGRATVVVTPSPFLQHELRDFRADIRFIPNPIELAQAIYRLRERPTPSLVWVRSFHNVYNPSLPVRALQQLSGEFPGMRLTMIGPDKGDGSLQRTLEAADALGVGSLLEVQAGVPYAEIPSILNRGDIFINSSNYDTAPRSVIEAMANGLCIVSTNVGGVPWLVKDGQEGLLVPSDDPQAMAAAVRRILTEPGLAASLSANARAKSILYDWYSILPQWESLFSEVIGMRHG